MSGPQYQLKSHQNTDTNIVEVELDLDWSWLPSEIHGGSDTRNLGVAVRRVWLE